MNKVNLFVIKLILFQSGRGLESSISLLSLYISRVHCQLFLSDDHKWFVKDLGSLNGIFINDKLIDQSAVMEVHPGDFLGFGINWYDNKLIKLIH